MKKIKKILLINRTSYYKKIIALLLLTSIFIPHLNIFANETPSNIPFSEMEDEIDALVNRYLDVTTPGAAVVVIHEGEIIFSRGYGYADIEAEIPIDPVTTVFEYASMTKTFTWIAVMQLVEQGIIDLDADITTYLPDDFDFDLPFTMRDLMNHSAGFAMPLYGTLSPEVTLREYLSIANPRQRFTPGTSSAYSNWGVTLAGYVVGYLTEQNFVDYERENILLPAGMENTLNLPDWLGNDDFLQHRAHGYAPRRNGFRNRSNSYYPDYPAGSLNGTAEDLARWMIALTPEIDESGPLFESRATLDQVFTPSYLDPAVMRGTHHGFMRWGSDEVDAFGHGGNMDGFTTFFSVVPEARFGVAVLVNSAQETSVVAGIANLLLGNTMDNVVPTVDNLPSATSVEGTFFFQNRVDVEGTLTEFMHYLPIFLTRVTAVDDNTITVNLGMFGVESTYQQIEPYVFRIVDTDNPFVLAIGHDELHFRMEDGRPVLISSGSGWDLAAIPSVGNLILLFAPLLLWFICASYFINKGVSIPIIKFLAKVRKKEPSKRQKKKLEKLEKLQEPDTPFYRLRFTLVLCGGLLAVSAYISILIGLFADSISLLRNALLVLNYIIVAFASVTLIRSIVAFRAEDVDKKGTRRYIITVVLLTLFIILSWHLNFFSFSLN